MHQLLLDASTPTGSWWASSGSESIYLFTGILILIIIILYIRHLRMQKKFPPGKGKIFNISYPGPKVKSIKALLKERHDALYIRLIGKQSICPQSGNWIATIECY